MNLEPIKLIRPSHYLKNLLVFAPIFFADQLFNDQALLASSLAFIAFSACASAIYIFNDYQDQDSDRQHPVKNARPLAKGSVSNTTAFMMMSALLALGLVLAIYLSLTTFYFVAGYCLFNFAYSLGLKRIPGLDVGIIGMGFILRLLVGSSAAGIPLSPWIITITFFAALFLALAKRRHDLSLTDERNNHQPKYIANYPKPLLGTLIVLSALACLILYMLYTHWGPSSPTFALYSSNLFVCAGFARYLYVTFKLNNSGSPVDLLLRDPILIISLSLWLLCFSWILYI